MNQVIRVQQLSKDFGDIKAVRDLSFSVGEGQVYGFLGQNGAGKSTTIRMLLTLIEPSSGTIEIFGMNLKKHRKEILRRTGAIIEKPDLYKYLTAKENLRIFSRLSGVKVPDKKIMDQLALVGLAERADSKVKTYSQGMKQRLGLATALVHDPALILLDEPTNGLDPQGIADMRNLILHLSRDLGKTLLVSSHLLSEMEMVADHMLIIHKGKKVVEGRVTELLNPEQSIVELLTPDIPATLVFLRQSGWAATLKELVNGTIRLEFNKQQIPELNRQLVEKGIPVLSLRPLNSLEDYFLSLTKE
ncbi:MAG: ABC transporter ATP-binding protein [Sphingobacteriales bacterium]|nr:ABC transporter ATP-binding protein [Sphingobacteriales bacterium]